jgi:hypothetical protein
VRAKTASTVAEHLRPAGHLSSGPSARAPRRDRHTHGDIPRPLTISLQVRSELLAFLNFSHRGMEFLLAFTVGALACAVLLSLVPMTTAVRAGVVALGVIASATFVFTRPYGEDRLAWAIIVGFALLVWFTVFASAGVVRARRRDH